MSAIVYPATAVDGVLKSASAIIHGLVDEAAAQEQRINSLHAELQREKAANAGKVVLDQVKTASSKGVSPELANAFVGLLASHAIIKEADMDKYAAACIEDPDAIARFSIRAIKLAEGPVSQGQGVKSASGSSGRSELQKENELWMSII